MNYPFANAIIDFVRTGNSDALKETVFEILENYPEKSVNLMMNHIGTHDTARILTRLSKNNDNFGDRAKQSQMKLSEEECLALDELIGYCFQQNYGQMKKVFFDGFKKGFELSNELENFLK